MKALGFKESQRPLILFIEDEESIRRFVHTSLELNQYEMIEAPDAERGTQLLRDKNPDLILLDLGLPRINGMSFLKQIREWTNVPVIILTAQDSEAEKVACLDAGADDFLTKPFRVGELLARIRAIMRRSATSILEPVFQLGPLTIDRIQHSVLVSNAEIKLSPIEFRLLNVLAKNVGKLVSHRQLLLEVWGPHSVEHNQYLRVYINQLRKKLQTNDYPTSLIKTESGVGYRLHIDPIQEETKP